jgi:hypothetical protein
MATTAVPSSSTTTRPKHPYYVPAVRIMRLADRPKGAEQGKEIPGLEADVVRVEVTRVNTGAGQYAITLNNWFDSLVGDRKADKSIGQGEVIVDDRPLFPRFKYNDFRFLQFGARLRIDMRYLPSDPSSGAGEGWVPMISGAITDMKFTFSASEGARLIVSGEDDLAVLQAKNKKKVHYSGKSEESIVHDVLERANGRTRAQLRLAEPAIEWPSFATDDSRALAEAHLEGQSYLEYLQKFADRMDFEVFTEFSDLSDPSQGIELHIEPSRSRLPLDAKTYVLQREVNLLDLSPTIKVADQFTVVTVRGRHRIRTRPVRVTAEATSDILSDELPSDGRSPQPQSGPDWREELYDCNPEERSNQTNLDDERARVLAETILRRKAREFMVINGTTIGLPLLRPGKHVEIRGMRPPFDGYYYVTQTVHSFGADGLRTRFTARRPGMPHPPYGETGSGGRA